MRVFRILSPLLLIAPLVAFGGQRPPKPDLDPDFDGERIAADEEDDDGADVDDVDDEASADDDGESFATPMPGKPARARMPRGGCPNGMVRVGEMTCMDKFEAPNRAGARPLVMQSADDAEAYCSSKHKRLCSEDEWISACQGDDHREYPYGDDHEDGKCNDDKEWRQVKESVLAKWPDDEAKQHTRELYQASPSGSKRGCKTRTGVSDLTGNVEEWVTTSRSHANGYAHILIGCYWSGCYGGGKPTCHSTNGAHGPEFRFYETGFRCCKDPASHRSRDAGR
jgi:hypothetical protein